MSQKAEFVSATELPVLRCQQGLTDLVATMYSSIWDTRGYDVELRRALGATLMSVSACGVIGHISGRAQLVHFNRYPDADAANLQAASIKELPRVIASQRGIRFNKPIRFKVGGKFAGVLVVFPDEARRDEQERSSSSSQQHSDVHYCCLFYSPSRVFQAQHAMEEEDRFANFHANTTLPLLFDVFRHRERRFAPFAVTVSERYWEDSLKYAGEPEVATHTVFRPPWEGGDCVHRTATLCVDLRKSTFCMEHSDEPEKFGRWLDTLVQVVTKVCHSHGGVFDKFTGDGGLIHFLEKECEAVYGKTAITCAVNCAIATQLEVKTLLEELRTFIRFDSGLLGAGIAVDIGEAYWSLDYRDNPIVVGRAVVGACRICDESKAGKTRLTNIACKLLPKELLLELLEKGLKQVGQSTKELDKQMEVLVWEF